MVSLQALTPLAFIQVIKGGWIIGFLADWPWTHREKKAEINWTIWGWTDWNAEYYKVDKSHLHGQNVHGGLKWHSWERNRERGWNMKKEVGLSMLPKDLRYYESEREWRRERRQRTQTGIISGEKHFKQHEISKCTPKCILTLIPLNQLCWVNLFIGMSNN